MKRAWRIASTMVGVSYAYMLEYRAEIVLWAVSGALPLIMMGAWMRASAAGYTGLSAGEFARYFFAVFVVRQFTTVWVIYDFEYEVVEGRLSSFLLQPIDPVFRHLADHAGERLTRLPFIAAFAVGFFLLFPGAAWMPRPAAVATAILACAGGFVLRFAMQYTVAMLAFWTERVSSVEQLSYLLFFLFAGELAPLDLYPPGVRAFAACTPFPYVAYFPAQILTGRPVPLAQGFAVMAAWTAGFVLLNRVLWRRGLKHFSAMGA